MDISTVPTDSVTDVDRDGVDESVTTGIDLPAVMKDVTIDEDKSSSTLDSVTADIDTTALSQDSTVGIDESDHPCSTQNPGTADADRTALSQELIVMDSDLSIFPESSSRLLTTESSIFLGTVDTAADSSSTAALGSPIDQSRTIDESPSNSNLRSQSLSTDNPQSVIIVSQEEPKQTLLDLAFKQQNFRNRVITFMSFINMIQSWQLENILSIPRSKPESLERLCLRSKCLVTLLIALFKDSEITYFAMIQFFCGCHHISSFSQPHIPLQNILRPFARFFINYDIERFIKILKKNDIPTWCKKQVALLGDSKTWVQCPFCPLAYPKNGFVCEICKKSFMPIGKLYSHKKMEHDVKKASYNCWICDDVFLDANLFETHIETIHYCCLFDFHIMCPLCDLRCEPYNDLIKHFAKVHFMSVDSEIACPECESKMKPQFIRAHLAQTHKYGRVKTRLACRTINESLVDNLCGPNIVKIERRGDFQRKKKKAKNKKKDIQKSGTTEESNSSLGSCIVDKNIEKEIELENSDTQEHDCLAVHSAESLSQISCTESLTDNKLKMAPQVDDETIFLIEDDTSEHDIIEIKVDSQPNKRICYSNSDDVSVSKRSKDSVDESSKGEGDAERHSLQQDFNETNETDSALNNIIT